MADISNNKSDTIITGTNRADFIYNHASSVTIDAGAGDDEIGNYGGNVSISGGTGKDSIQNSGSFSTIDGGIGNDSIYNGFSIDYEEWYEGGSDVNINGGAGSDYIYNDGDNSSISGGDGNDYIRSYGASAIIACGAGDDEIYSYYRMILIATDTTTIESGSNTTIYGGDGNDTIFAEGFDNFVSGGTGNDIISMLSAGNMIEYSSGDGNDTIYGFNGMDSLNIAGSSYSTEVSGKDVLVKVGEGSILLKDANGMAFVINENIEGNTSVDLEFIKLSEGNDTFRNIYAKVTIDGGKGDDDIGSTAKKVSINGGDGSDIINSHGDSVTIDGGAGNDFIYNDGSYSTIDAGSGNDFIYNDGSYSTINAGAGNDSIKNYLDDVTISGGAGNDSIYNACDFYDDGSIDYYTGGSNVLFKYNAGDGNDIIYGFRADSMLQIGDGTGTYSTLKSGDDIIVRVGEGLITLVGAASLKYVSIYGKQANSVEPLVVTGTEYANIINNRTDSVIVKARGGNDSLRNYGDAVSVDAGAGNDSIRNYGDNATLEGGLGDDYIRNYSDNVTISGGTGNDTLRNALGENVLFKYNVDDGNDVIIGFNESSTLQIGDGTATYSTVKSSNNIIVTAATGKITLQGAASLDTLNIEGIATTTLTNSNSNSVTLKSAIMTADATARTTAIKIVGNALDNSILGGSANDTLYGKDGDDYLVGNSGNDKLYGQNGNDMLWGGTGNDTLTGGAGNDLFIYSSYNPVKYGTLTKSGNTYTFTQSGSGKLTNITLDGVKAVLDKSCSGATINAGDATLTVTATDDFTIDAKAWRLTLDNVTEINLYAGTIQANENIPITVKDKSITAINGAMNVGISDYGQVVIGDLNPGDKFTVDNTTYEMTTAGLWDAANSRLVGRGISSDLTTFWIDDATFTSVISVDENGVLDLTKKLGSDGYLALVVGLTDGEPDPTKPIARLTYTDARGYELNDPYNYAHELKSVKLSPAVGFFNTWLETTVNTEMGTYIVNGRAFTAQTALTITTSSNSATLTDGTVKLNQSSKVTTASGNIYANTGTITVSVSSGKVTIGALNTGDKFTVDNTTYEMTAAGLYDAANQKLVKAGVSADKTTFTLGETADDGATDGDDIIKNYDDAITINALGGNDTIRSYGDSAQIDSGAGNDSVRNYGDNVSINAGAGNDIIRNQGDNVTIYGGTGNDTLRNQGDNVLFNYSAGDGNDVIIGFNESSTLRIGNGTATYSTVKSGNNIIVTAGSGKLTLQGAATLDTLNILGKDSSVLTLTNSSKAAVTLSSTYKSADASKRTAAIKITGNALDNSIVGGSKNDTLYGKDGNDYLNGGSGVDKVYGGNGADTLWGGAGNDSLWGNDGNDLFIYSAGNDVIADYAAGDKISLGAAISKTSISGSDATFTIGSNTLKVKNGKGKEIAFVNADGTEQTIIGGAYLADDNVKPTVTLASWREVADATARTSAIKITGNALANTILGGSGKDSLYGKDGNDYLNGGGGVDKLYGGNGADTLIGGAGNDSLWGNAGADTFIYTSGDGKDVISGFDNDDMLQITGTFSASVNSAGSVIFKVGSTASAITLKNFTATTFNVNGTAYKISGSKFVK